MLNNRQQLCALIPHDGAMCLLERVVDWDETRIRCVAFSQTDGSNPLRFNGILPSICGVEYAAQAMAVHGALCQSRDDEPPKAYIAALRGIEMHAPGLDGYPELMVDCTRYSSDEFGSIYDFEIGDGAERLLEGRITIMTPGV